MSLPSPHNLRCEYLENPLGVDVAFPRFSWILNHPGRAQRQSAYQIIVSSSPELALQEEGDIWDSGKVFSEKHIHIVYGGLSLQSSQAYSWRAKWWDKEGKQSPYSEVAFFETGILHPAHWRARWISRKNFEEFTSQGSVMQGKNMGDYIHARTTYLRQEFEVKGEVKRARAYVCGLGLYEFRLNGKKVGDRVLDPAQTDYKKIALYSTFDITAYLNKKQKQGSSPLPAQMKNAIGVILGNGRHIKNYGYAYPKLICQVLIEYENGKKEHIVTDKTWKASSGPLMMDGLYFGERYDARLEMPGWDMPGFVDSSWENVKLTDGPPLASQMMPPIRLTQKIKPQKITNPKKNIYIFDFGQNFTGWVRLKVKGPRGTEVKLRHAELLHHDGTLNTSPNQSAEATDIYILKGEGLETHEPRFTYHGFRYVELTGFPGVPDLESLEGCFVHSDVDKTGEFFSSNDLLNKIHQNVLWGQLSNLMGLPTDCPQRDERYGWLGDAHLAAEEAIYNFDMAAFYTKFLKDIRTSQKDEGSLADIAPAYLEHLYPADPAWASAYFVLAWHLYWYYGDTRILEEHYEGLKSYAEFLRRNSVGHLIRALGKYGDWCPPGSIFPKKTPVELTSTWFYFYDVWLLSQIALILQKENEARHYSRLASEIKQAFNRAFLEDDQYAAIRVSPVDNYPNQTSNILPLYLDMVPEEKKEKVFARLLESIIKHQDYHLDTGIIGTRYLLDVLTEHGHPEVAYKIVNHKTYPGWGYMVEEGATTLWERWEKITGRGMNSHNHIMLGSVDAWFYKTISGINCLSSGWTKIKIQPHLFEDLKLAKASLRTVKGKIKVGWEKKDSSLDLAISLPVGSEAEVYIPLLSPNSVVKERGKTIWENQYFLAKKAEEILFERKERAQLVLRVGSGDYQFNVSEVLEPSSPCPD